MNISLPSGLAEFVEREVAAGTFGSASEVVGEGLRLLLREREEYAEKLSVLRREVGRGLEDVREGRVADFSMAKILQELDAEDERAG